MLHAQKGRQKYTETVFAMAWGEKWRDRFESFSCKEQWLAARPESVRQACEALGLLAPHDKVARMGHDQGNVHTPPEKRAMVDSWNIEATPIPILLARDNPWHRSTSRPQLDIVVDN